MGNVLYAVVAGDVYCLDDGVLCYWVGDDGLGMSPVTRISERSPNQHGETDRGYRLDPRAVRLVFEVITDSMSSWESKRASLLDIFKPLDSIPVKIRLVLSSGTYQLDTYYVGSMGMPSADRMKWNQTVVVDLKAPDPTWYKTPQAVETFALGGGEDLMEVPTEIPMTVGASSIDSTSSILYGGTFKAFPVIRITGAITDPVIENTSTGLKLDFTGVTIAPGDYYEIDLRFGYKTVVDSSGTNKIADLVTSTSDLVDWALEPDPSVSGGLNSIRVTGTGVTSATKVTISYYERFVGR